MYMDMDMISNPYPRTIQYYPYPIGADHTGLRGQSGFSVLFGWTND